MTLLDTQDDVRRVTECIALRHVFPQNKKFEANLDNGHTV